jgi:hypothetical protein
MKGKDRSQTDSTPRKGGKTRIVNEGRAGSRVVRLLGLVVLGALFVGLLVISVAGMLAGFVH